MKIEILRVLDPEQNLVFRSLSSNRKQEIILMPFVEMIQKYSSCILPEALSPDYKTLCSRATNDLLPAPYTLKGKNVGWASPGR